MSPLEFLPLSRRIGAEVIGLDLREACDEATAETLRAAYRRYRLLLLRGQQHVSPAEQARFARIFGDVILREKNTMRGPDADTQHVSNVRKDGLFGTGDLDFHVDQLFQPMPLKALILTALEVPEQGGDTLFADATAVAEMLPADLRARAEAAECRHAYTFAGQLAKDWNVHGAETTGMSQVQPMLWPDPETGARALWVNKMTTVEVLGLDAAAGREMMAAVRAPLYDEAIQYRHHWSPGDMVLWNNRTLQHARTPYDESLPRTLRRTPIN